VSLDLSSQLARYGGQLREGREQLDLEEVIWRGDQPAVGRRGRSAPAGPWAWPWVIGAVAFLAVVLGGSIQILLSDRGGSPEDSVPPADLGVFEPMRGRVVYVVDDALYAVDPADPRIGVTMEVPPAADGDIGADAGEAVPVGWSHDGTLLALEDEFNGESYLMNSSGGITRVPWETIEVPRGCCMFAGPNWLSPDGASAVSAAGFELRILDLLSLVAGPSIELVDSELRDVQGGQPYMTTWSPDGSQVAFVVDRVDGDLLVPTIRLWDVENGDLRELVDDGFGHIRNMAWSPDGLELLVIAGDYQFRTVLPLSNPLVSPIETDIYLVAINGSGTRSISSGHFVAAAWSPDGSQFAAVEYGSGYHEVTVMNADGSDERRITDLVPGPSGAFTGVAWHPVR
jgi:WD40 repeat protein